MSRKVKFLENIIWDLLRILDFNMSGTAHQNSLKQLRRKMENKKHIKKRLRGTRTLTHFTRG